MSKKLFIAIFAFVLFLTSSAAAQSSAFVFQGKLNDGSVPANGTYQFTFTMYDAAAGGNQIGQTITDLPATVSNGIFAVNLDFGASSFDGAARYIEVGVRLSGSGQNYTILTPRQQVTSTPYSVKSLKSDQAVTADNSLNLGGIAASQYVITTDSRMSDDRNPLPDSPNYVQNTTNLQSNSNFNISGEGKANVLSANSQFDLGGFRVFHINGNYNTFVGFETGNSLTSGTFNAIFGTSSGRMMTSGTNNSFFGSLAGRDNLTGSDNSFFGQAAGMLNTIGAGNSFFGYGAGVDNTTGAKNTFVGFLTGQTNANGNENTFIGYKANGAAGITNATAIGANAFVGQSNTMVLGTDIITVKVPGNFTVAQTFSANVLDSATVYKINGNRVFHLTGTDNTFIGFESGNSITTGGFNAFFGSFAGKETTSGLNNSFFGSYAGRDNLTGGNNAFFGANAGLGNKASFNSFFGSNSGSSNANGANNSFFGVSSGLNNTGGNSNTFLGANSGQMNSTGNNNVAVGANALQRNTTGINNTFIGTNADFTSTNTTGTNNTALGFSAGIAPNVTGATAIGESSFADENNLIALGRNISTVRISGKLRLTNLVSNGNAPLCRDSNNLVALCSSPLANPNEEITAALAEQKAQIDAQAEQIKRQEAEISALKSLVCANNPAAALCRAQK